MSGPGSKACHQIPQQLRVVYYQARTEEVFAIGYVLPYRPEEITGQGVPKRVRMDVMQSEVREHARFDVPLGIDEVHGLHDAGDGGLAADGGGGIGESLLAEHEQALQEGLPIGPGYLPDAPAGDAEQEVIRNKGEDFHPRLDGALRCQDQ